MKDFLKGLTLTVVGLGALYVVMFGDGIRPLGACLILAITAGVVKDWS